MEKQKWEESERRKEVRRSEKGKSKKKEDSGTRKGRKVAIHWLFFSNYLWLRGSKSRLAKAVGAEPSGQMSDENLHAVVARGTCPSQNVKNTTCSDPFWTFRCRRAWQQAIVHLVKSEPNVRVYVAVSTTTTTTLHWTTRLHYTTLHYTSTYDYNYNYITLHYTTLHYATLHSTSRRYTTLHCTALRYTQSHYTLHHTSLHYTTLR